MTRLRVIDFETTGLKPPSAGIVEVGWTDVVVEDDKVEVQKPFSILTDPNLEMNIEALATHHIHPRELKGAPHPDTFPQVSFFADDAIHVSTYVAHSAQFEQQFFNPGKPWICTQKCAYRMLPKCPSFKLQVIRYFLDLDLDPELAMPPHRAGPDSYVTAQILAQFIRVAQLKSPDWLQTMIKWSSEPGLLPSCPLKKFRGKKWNEVDTSYLEWIIAQPTMEGDIKFTAQFHLNRRRQ